MKAKITPIIANQGQSNHQSKPQKVKIVWEN